MILSIYELQQDVEQASNKSLSIDPAAGVYPPYPCPHVELLRSIHPGRHRSKYQIFGSTWACPHCGPLLCNSPVQLVR